MKYNNVSFRCCDVGGSERLPSSYRHLYEECRGVVFVVDSCDFDSLGGARYELHKILKRPEINGIPLLVLANKQDSKKALPLIEVAHWLDLQRIRNRKWHLEGTSSFSYESLAKGFLWLAETIDGIEVDLSAEETVLHERDLFDEMRFNYEAHYKKAVEAVESGDKSAKTELAWF